MVVSHSSGGSWKIVVLLVFWWWGFLPVDNDLTTTTTAYPIRIIVPTTTSVESWSSPLCAVRGSCDGAAQTTARYRHVGDTPRSSLSFLYYSGSKVSTRTKMKSSLSSSLSFNNDTIRSSDDHNNNNNDNNHPNQYLYNVIKNSCTIINDNNDDDRSLIRFSTQFRDHHHDVTNTTTTGSTAVGWSTNNNDHMERPRLLRKTAAWINGTEIITRLFPSIPSPLQYRLPPFMVEDWNVLWYDLVLLINLVVSISFWVVHRWDISYIGIAFNEGCLLSLLWIIAGLYNGSFLYSAIDGHQRPNSSNSNNNSILSMKIATNNLENNQFRNTTTPNDSNGIQRPNHQSNNNNNVNDKNNHGGGPMAAGLLAFHTYINTMNLRLVYALVVALLEHRTALSTASELLIPLEFGYGLVLMILWRALHSSYVLR